MTPPTITLENGQARAVILASAGATVASLDIGGTPVLMAVRQPVAAGAWPAGGMPICFPFAGRVWHEGKLGSYVTGASLTHGTHGKEFTSSQQPSQPLPLPMPLHGFAFGSTWKIENQGNAEATLLLNDSRETQRIFPWRFTARIKYKLLPAALETQLSLRCDEILDAAQDMPMPVAPGLHPYFSAKHPVEKCDGYFSFAYDNLEVPALEAIAVTAEGNAGPKKFAADMLAAPTGASGLTVPLHNEVAHNLIFGGIAHRAVSIGKIRLSWTKESPWRHLVCWAKPDQHFFCVEPWYGLPDAVHRKDGVIKLQAGASCVFDFKIEIKI